MPFGLVVPPGCTTYTVLGPEDLEPLKRAVVQLISLRLVEDLDAPTILSLQKEMRQLTTEVREVGENSEDPLVLLLRDELRNTTKNSEYYRGLVVEIGEKFGVAARTADDGSVADGVLCAKVPELVAKALRNLRIARESFALPPSEWQPADPRFYANGVPRYVKCRGCGNEGLFVSPHTGLCAPCDKKDRGESWAESTPLARRRALLTLLAAAPVLAYQTEEFKVDTTGEFPTYLLDLSMTFPESRAEQFLFLRLRINGKEELRLSIKDALDILRGKA